jgi:hypothetical protein
MGTILWKAEESPTLSWFTPTFNNASRNFYGHIFTALNDEGRNGDSLESEGNVSIVKVDTS